MLKHYMTGTWWNMYAKSAGGRTWACWVSGSSRWCLWSRLSPCSGPGWCPLVPQSSRAVWRKGRGRTWTRCSASGSPVFPIGETIKSRFIYFPLGEKKNCLINLLYRPCDGCDHSDNNLRISAAPMCCIMVKSSNFVPVLHMKFKELRKINNDILWYIQLIYSKYHLGLNKYMCHINIQIC